ncbi:M15 family metallopeptidase [Cytobacillus sp. OWB-43]|uniref:M15 family metallopeptidase n=1 Tax=unclassified Cytobacillus TaxID=2675268 RepID=UPI002AFED6CE|nr:M15 family metallopeptidase [Cytobacillus sp. OWB-43]MEA1854046.1 M15 family metallopeptidase [Cytobacillus sp. OWB-43]
MTERMVPLSRLSERIKIEPYYYKMGLNGTHNECYVRSEVATQLLKVVTFLPEGIGVHVWDGWRSFETQLAIYEATKKELMLKGFQGVSLERELAKYVAKPTKDVDHPSPHLSGGAVDLTLFDGNGLLPMGSEFDEFHERSQLDYFEEKKPLTSLENIYLANRKLLKRTMLNAGFISNIDEWWHYEYGTKSWANKVGVKQYFRGILEI